jgi:hypothetical protein
MSDVKNIPIEIKQGATFRKKFNWYGGGLMIREIEGVDEGCPTTVTITAHGLPAGAKTPIYIQDVKGARSLNSGGKEVVATYVDADNFTVPAATRDETYKTGTGCAHWFLPKALTDWIARMDIRESIDDTTTLVSLTSPDDIIITVSTAEIEVVIDADVTAALDFDSGVYDLELEDSQGEVTRLIEGNVAFIKEVTRP